MKSKPIGILFGVLTLVAIVTIAPSAFATTVQVSIDKQAGSGPSAACVTANNCFSPNPINIAVGDTVTWTNTSSQPHTVTSGEPSENETGTIFSSGDLPLKAGATYSFTFNNAGEYKYFCMLHPWMVGDVIVGTAASGTTGSTTSGNMTGMTGSSGATPEFGPVASLVLVFAIVGVVIMSARTRGFLKL